MRAEHAGRGEAGAQSEAQRTRRAEHEREREETRRERAERAGRSEEEEGARSMAPSGKQAKQTHYCFVPSGMLRLGLKVRVLLSLRHESPTTHVSESDREEGRGRNGGRTRRKKTLLREGEGWWWWCRCNV